MRKSGLKGGVFGAGLAAFLLVGVGTALFQEGIGQDKRAQKEPWIEEIERVFVRSEVCRQCHDRHYEEMAGLREMTMDLKLMGRVDAALLHGTALPSPVFRAVMGIWLQTNPSAAKKQQCLSCHAPAVMVFPQHTDRIIGQVMSGKVTVEGISCASCHLVEKLVDDPKKVPSFQLTAGKTMYGPFKDSEDNMVHTSFHSPLYKGANFCASCHFEKLRDFRSPTIDSEILEGAVCQSCHMEQSTGSSTSKRGAMTREIGRHYFRGIVIPGLMLKNRNLQAEWMPRLEVEAKKNGTRVEGQVAVMNGAVPHNFPDGDPVLKQFYITVSVKDKNGRLLGSSQKTFGTQYEQLLEQPLGDILVKGGTTKRVPFELTLSGEGEGLQIDAVLTYSLIPKPASALLEGYLKTLPTDAERDRAKRLIADYAEPRVLTFRTKSL
ncbi:MAG TPA: multiheme c-type cytochrome [Nitrospirales bacterium]